MEFLEKKGAQIFSENSANRVGVERRLGEPLSILTARSSVLIDEFLFFGIVLRSGPFLRVLTGYLVQDGNYE